MAPVAARLLPIAGRDVEAEPFLDLLEAAADLRGDPVPSVPHQAVCLAESAGRAAAPELLLLRDATPQRAILRPLAAGFLNLEGDRLGRR